MFFVLLFFCVPDRTQEWLWTKLAGEDGAAAGGATGHVPLAGDEFEAENDRNVNATGYTSLHRPLVDDVDQQVRP